MRMTRRHALGWILTGTLLAGTLLTACLPVVDVTQQDPTTYARLRVLALTRGTGTLSVLSTVADELPGAVDGLVSPALSSFRDVPAGEASLFVQNDGAPLIASPLPQPLTTGASYTLAVTGEGAAARMTLIAESLTPVAGRSLVRLVDASTLGATAQLDGAAVALPAEPTGDWLDLAPAPGAALALRRGNDLLATFSELDLADGDHTTLVVLGAPPERPIRLMLIRDRADGSTTTELRDFDGAEIPSAQVRLLNTVPDSGPVTVAVVGGDPLVEHLTFAGLSGSVPVPVSASLEVRYEEGATAPVTITPDRLALEVDGTYTLPLVGLREPVVQVVEVPQQGTRTFTTALPVTLLAWRDERSTPADVQVRLGVAAPSLVPVSIALAGPAPEEPQLCAPVETGRVGDYTPATAGSLDARLKGTLLGQPFAATVDDLTFPPGSRLTLVTVVGTNPPGARMLVLDDLTGTVLSAPVVTPDAPPQPPAGG